MVHQLGRGVAWSYITMAVSGVLQLLVVAVTARLLPPESFGLVAMANVILRFSSYFANMGVGRALIQRQHVDEDDVRAAFTSSVALGVATALTIIALAPLAAAYYRDPNVTAIMRWLALTFAFTGLGATSRALLQRRLQFRATGVTEVISYATGYALPTLALAASGFGVWSLVAGAIGQSAVSAALTMALARHSWRPMLRWAPHARLLRFGATVSGISVVEFLGSTLDTLVIGRFGTATQVGLYNRALMFASLPTYQVNQGIARVLFPVLSAGRDDSRAFAEALNTATTVAIRIVIPLGVGMALVAPELVSVVLGREWDDVVPLFAILAPALALNVLITFPGLALEAVGRLKWKAIVQLLYVAFLAIGLFVTGSTVSGLNLRSIAIVMAIGIVMRAIAIFGVAAASGVTSTQLTTRMLSVTIAAASATAASFSGVLWYLRRGDASDELVVLLCIVTGAAVVLLLLRRDVVRLLRERGRAAV